MKTLSTLTSLLFLLVICDSAFAGIRPSFTVEQCSWHATDIVVVTEGKVIDGVFTVIETWKGDLKPGETITIPELEQFKEKDARLINRWWNETRSGPSEYVTGERMILFLTDAKKARAGSREDAKQDGESRRATSRWNSSNPMSTEIKYSTVWIENGKVSCFIQPINPGPSLLLRPGITEEELRDEALGVIGTQNNLNAALALADPATRAQSLEPFVQNEVFLAREGAFAGLTECGEAALPVLRRMLANEALRKLHAAVIEVFAKAGGKVSGSELIAWLYKELEFWRQTAPALQVGWWNGKGFETLEEVEPQRDRWMAIYQAVQELGKMKYTEAEQVLTELRDFWRSKPSLRDDQINEACDETLREFRAIKKNDDHPRVPQ